MKAEFYKGVKLIEGRTPEMIDIVIENYESMNTKQLAVLLGFGDYHKVVPIVRRLTTVDLIKRKNVTEEEVDPIEAILKAEEVEVIELIPEVIEEPKRANTFTNYEGDGKHEAREIISNYITRTNPIGSNILTLPADKWMMEKLILSKKKGYKFTAVEGEKETYKDMVKNLAGDEELLNSVHSVHNTTIGEIIATAKENTFSNAIMDYCGVVDSSYDELKQLLSNNLVKKGGYITITFAKVNRTLNNKFHMNNYSNRYARVCNKRLTSAEITDFLMDNLVFSIQGYKLKTKFEYKDNKRGYGMLLYVIRREE